MKKANYNNYTGGHSKNKYNNIIQNICDVQQIYFVSHNTYKFKPL